jgi:predicted RNase H-like nuclease (RuvC/YqgF family)
MGADRREALSSMDQDLREYLDALKTNLDQRFVNTERLITDVKESLERQIGDLEREMRDGFAQVNTRFDTQAIRLDRHAALWQTGRRWSGKMDDWAEKLDQALETKDREIAELRGRIEKLEKKNGL